MSTTVDTTAPTRQQSSSAKTTTTTIADSQFIDTPPSPGRMAVAIAGYPYSIAAAVGDIGDNSVEAGATRMAILIKNTGALDDAIVFVDNGSGIAPDILDEVLRAGSRTEALYSQDSLSRFGIGLKGAGGSLGRRITILTLYSGQPLRRRSIDLDDVMATDSWRQDTRDPNADEAAYFQWALQQLPGSGPVPESGTVIVIEKLTRRRELLRQLSTLVRSLGETFAKFLARDGAGLMIRVDDKEVFSSDPLHRDHPQIIQLYPREEVVLESGATLIFSSVVLPHPSQVSANERPLFRYSTANQGFYVYRNGRLIAAGAKLGMFKPDFHLNNFRAELLYTTAADDDIRLDVAKSTVELSAEVESKIQEFVVNSLRTADTLWREKDVLTKDDILGLFDESNRLIASKAKLLTRRIDPKTGKVVQRELPPLPPAKPSKGGVKSPNAEKGKGDVTYVKPVDTLPHGILYRPVYDGQVGAVVVEINLAHPFSKAVFNVPAEIEGKRKIARKATTAVQQLLYVLGMTEYAFPDDDVDLFEQFRKHASLNLSAVVGD